MITNIQSDDLRDLTVSDVCLEIGCFHSASYDYYYSLFDKTVEKTQPYNRYNTYDGRLIDVFIKQNCTTSLHRQKLECFYYRLVKTVS